MRLVHATLLTFILTTAAAPGWCRQLPVDRGTVTSGIGWRLDPFGSGRMIYHRGIDIAVPVGTKVYPTHKGTVLFSGLYRGYGHMVAVDHGNGLVSIYGHNDDILVKPGQRVTEQTVIALSGNTGRSTGPHLHYEERRLKAHQKLTPEEIEEELMEVVREKVDAWVEEWVAKKGVSDSLPAGAELPGLPR